jgi:3-(3-hydroxy-phenyl)propionate hydroxylase
MNSGLRDANNLAWKLASVVRGEIGPGLLDTYEIERRDHVWAMIEMALRMGRVMAPRNRAEAFLVQNAFRLLGLYPPARDYVAQMRFKPTPRFANGFLLADGRDARRTLVGRLFPQPRVVVPDGTETSLDDVLGQGFAVIVRSERPDLLHADAILPPDGTWGAVTPSLVVIGPPGSETVQAEGMLTVSQLRAEEWAAVPPDHVFVLRPDRYVAACVPLMNWPEKCAEMGTLIAATFDARRAAVA